MRTPFKELLLIYGKQGDVYRVFFLGTEKKVISVPETRFKNVQELGSYSLDLCKRENLTGVRAVSVEEWNDGIRGVESVSQLSGVLGVIGGRLANPYADEPVGNFFQRIFRS